MGNRARNTSPWAKRMLGRIERQSDLVVAHREETGKAEAKLHALVQEAMHYGITNGQIMERTDLFSSPRLYQIKNGSR